MIFADAQLARRVEAAEASNARGCGLRDGAAVLEIAGGCAIFLGSESPLSQAVGIGLNGPVGPQAIGEIESFFRSRGARVTLDVCPLADPGLLPILAARGYHLTEFSNVLVKRLSGNPELPTPRVRRAAVNECDLWCYTVGRGYFDTPELSEQEMDVGRAIFAMPGALCYLAGDESGRPVAGAAAALYDGLIVLFADSTIASSRRCGFQRELIAARLNEAIFRGCDLATASTQPGSASQRNYERMGFEVAYTRVTLVA